MERKASEILLEVENRVKNIEKQLKLQEFQLKMIIDAFNKFLKIKEDLPQISPQVLPEKITALEQQISPINSIAPIITPIIQPELTKEEEPIKKNYSNKERKIVVFQKITYGNGKPAEQACVMIADTKGNLLKKVYTNKNGLWQMAAVPGVYVISVYSETKDISEIIEYTQTFEIPTTAEKPIQLPVPTSTNKICI